MRHRIAALVIISAGLSGCYTPEGGIWPASGGAKTYYSYETRPLTIKLTDLRTDEVVFAMDVPAGKQLTYQFVSGRGDDPNLRPDLMRYEVFNIGTRTGSLGNSLTVPDQFSRRVDVHYREGVEMATRPTDEEIRTDTPEDRPDWWSPEGGEKPRDRRGLTNYDG